MLDLRFVVDNLDTVRAGLARRGFSDAVVLDAIHVLATERRRAIGVIEKLRQERNQASEAMAKVTDKTSEMFVQKRDALRSLGDKIKTLEAKLTEVESALTAHLLHLPNLPHSSTPEGLTERDNVELRVVGALPQFDFEVRDHVDLGVGLNMLDFERGAKISGARFVVLRGLGARLERALMQFMLDVHTDEHGYTEIWPPALVKDSALYGTSQLPKFAKDVFRIAKDETWEKEAKAQSHDLYLIPTAEVPLTNLHADEILEAHALPMAYAAYTPCFRSEAGSYGRDTRGMIRQHQFDKVELVQFCAPEHAEKSLYQLTMHAESILQKLGLHYRVVQLCAGDMGFAAQKAYDLEVWLPAQNAYREISSCSWFGDFQTRRIKARYRPEAAKDSRKKPKPQLLHTLNGSGLAIGRTVVALLEQYQRADGSVAIPEALQPYMGGRTVITSA